MKQFLLLLIFSFIVLGLTSCGDEESNINNNIESFVGTYDCTKYTGFDKNPNYASQTDLIVELDPDNEDHLLINTFSIPVDEDGNYGPDMIQSDMQLKLSFEGDSIFFEMQPFLINGIALPCIFEGEKK